MPDGSERTPYPPHAQQTLRLQAQQGGQTSGTVGPPAPVRLPAPAQSQRQPQPVSPSAPHPAAHARRLLLEAALSDNPLVREAWERQMQALQDELAGPNATPLERTLCERIATCWLDVHSP